MILWMFFFLMNKKNQPWNMIEYISVHLILPDVRRLPQMMLVSYLHGFIHAFPHCLGQAHFLRLLIELCFCLHVSIRSSSTQVHSGSRFSGTPQASKFSASLCFSDTACDPAVAHPKAVLPTTSFPSSFGRRTWIWQQRSETFCKITYRKDTVYLQGKQCHLWYRQWTARRPLYSASSTSQKPFKALLSDFSHFCCFRHPAWNTAVSGILLLNTLLCLFKCNIQKVPLNEKICSSVFSEPHNVYNVWIISPSFPLS